LEKENVEILDGACKPRKRVVTRHDIAYEVTALLKRGFIITRSIG